MALPTETFSQGAAPNVYSGQNPRQWGENNNGLGNTPYSFTVGVNNVANTGLDPLAEIGTMDPSRHIMFWEDFLNSTNTSTTLANNWIITVVQAGAGNAAYIIDDADGGVLKITNDSADDDQVFLQSVAELFKFETNKKLWFKTRFKVSDATQSDLVFGLQVRDTSPLAVSDGVWFQKTDGSTAMSFNVAASSSQTSNSTGMALANDTYTTLAFFWDGAATLRWFIYTDAVGFSDLKTGTSAITNLPTTELTVSFGIQNGEAVAKVLHTDYILVVEQRNAGGV